MPAAGAPDVVSLREIDWTDDHGLPLPYEASPFPHAARAAEAVRGIELGLRRGDEQRYLRLDLVPVPGAAGEPLLLVTGVDITAERSAVLSLADAERRMRLTAQHAPIGMAVVSTEGELVEVNDALCRLLGYERHELVGMTFQELTHPDDLALDLAHVAALLAGTGDTYRMEKRYITRDGHLLWSRLSVAVARDDSGRPQHFISMIEDASVEREATTVLAHRATHDQLTGLPNRTLLLERTDQALARAEWRGNLVALLFCDLDQFKLVNDSRGHLVGDAVLVETARRISACIRDTDVAARLGGDEFVVLCEDLGSRAEAETVAQRLIDALIEPMADAGGLTMTVSIGVAFATSGASSADLLRNADAAMYLAKSSGRDRLALFSPDLIEQATQRLDLEQELRDAIRSEALYLDYQPVCRLSDGSVVGYEGLIRWNHPVRGVLSPAAFLPIAEANDLVLEIDRFVLARACAAACSWGSGDDAPALSVNISARHVGRGLLPGLVVRSLRQSGLPATRLTLEITETALLGMTPTAQSELDTLVHLGVSLAIDDFGVGYSSLRHLIDVPATSVKIDRAFIADMAASRSNAAVVEAIVSLCSALGITVIAEGIEEPSQQAHLVSLGCHYGQGYLLGRPGRLDLTALAATP
jgi:diguanylate cyclase (GGDEF)-like protein/PAS domain S-box-containing protein